MTLLREYVPELKSERFERPFWSIPGGLGDFKRVARTWSPETLDDAILGLKHTIARTREAIHSRTVHDWEKAQASIRYQRRCVEVCLSLKPAPIADVSNDLYFWRCLLECLDMRRDLFSGGFPSKFRGWVSQRIEALATKEVNP